MGISFKEVSHYYPTAKRHRYTVAIEDINLDIAAKDEFVALIGQTGSGKSTLLSHINALLLPSKGNVEIFDKTITPNKNKNPKLKTVRKRVGFVFQFPEYQLFEETVLKDIMFAAKNFGFSLEEAEKKALEVADLLGIDRKLLSKSPFNLSGGQMRKVAIAGILAYDPEVILLDEPTRGLDPKTAKEIMELFAKINRDLHKTIIVISHDMNLVYEYANRVVVLNAGKIVYDGHKLNLFSSKIYENYHLIKPDILDLIDYLNAKLDLNLTYDCYKDEDLLQRMVKMYE